MIFLKNISDEFRVQAIVDINLTENPITNTRQWTELPKDAAGNVDKLSAKGFLERDKSKKYHIVLKPGKVMAFGRKGEFNEEQAEFIYKQYGAPELASSDGEINSNWLIEVDEHGNEVKDYLFKKYRVGSKQELYANKQRIVIKQE